MRRRPIRAIPHIIPPFIIMSLITGRLRF